MPDAASAADDHWHAPPARAVRLHACFVAAMLVLCAIGALAGPMLAMDEFGSTRFGIGRRPNTKRAIVSLREGTIDIFGELA